jgi:hypothetical protein
MDLAGIPQVAVEWALSWLTVAFAQVLDKDFLVTGCVSPLQQRSEGTNGGGR